MLQCGDQVGRERVPVQDGGVQPPGPPRAVPRPDPRQEGQADDARHQGPDAGQDTPTEVTFVAKDKRSYGIRDRLTVSWCP